jgi:hypothetical protein
MTRLLLGAAVLLAGCTHVHVAAVDYTTNQFAVCGSDYAWQLDLDKKAGEACSAGPTTLQCFEQSQGSATTAVVNGRYGFAATSDVKGKCCIYACSTAVAKQQ